MINIACSVQVNTNIEKADNVRISSDGAKMEERSEGMPMCGRNTSFGESLFEFLTNGKYIPSETARDSFLYLMGYSSVRPQALQQIQWLKSKQLLREVLQKMYANVIQGNMLTFAAVERGVQTAFVDKNGKQYALASNKPVPTQESDDIEDFFNNH